MQFSSNPTFLVHWNRFYIVSLLSYLPWFSYVFIRLPRFQYISCSWLLYVSMPLFLFLIYFFHHSPEPFFCDCFASHSHIFLSIAHSFKKYSMYVGKRRGGVSSSLRSSWSKTTLIGNDLNRDLIENGNILNRWEDIFPTRGKWEWEFRRYVRGSVIKGKTWQEDWG